MYYINVRYIMGTINPKSQSDHTRETDTAVCQEVFPKHHLASNRDELCRSIPTDPRFNELIVVVNRLMQDNISGEVEPI